MLLTFDWLTALVGAMTKRDSKWCVLESGEENRGEGSETGGNIGTKQGDSSGIK